MLAGQLPAGKVISIHALREEGDGTTISIDRIVNVFLSTPSARRATADPRGAVPTLVISIHALREEGDDACNAATEIIKISIHALREEGDRHRHVSQWREENFYPRPPRGGRQALELAVSGLEAFLSTPSARRATVRKWNYVNGILISIHALREEGD